jgi:hypothetical protein
MASPVLGMQVGKELLEALGLDGKKVRSVDLHFSGQEIVTATVVHMVLDEQARKVIDVIRKYELHEPEELPKERDYTGIDESLQVPV